MAKLRSAAYSDTNSSAPFADAATGVFGQLGEASQNLMAMQAQAAAIVLMDSASRYVEVLENMHRNFGWQHVAQAQRSHIRSVMEPLEAWVEAATGLQAVLAAASMQAWALAVFPALSAAETRQLAPQERRFDSVVIQFPERRRNSKA